MEKVSKKFAWILLYGAGLLVFILITFLILSNSSYSVPDSLSVHFRAAQAEKVQPPDSKSEVRPCLEKNCPAGKISFTIFSGAANVVAPKICIKNELVLGNVVNNADSGINVVVLNGRL
ncbi:Protein FAM3C [Merluccius polli]|uniref:Protein FAM3C n=1 Tax=Merluccius polli TaxID=89951 RepID=A0AA47M3K6_MERPO|nr:Protein FAM3C [Merluccius polli]